MKKYFLAIGLVAFLMTSCCDKQENKQNCENNCKDKKEQCDKHQHECDHHEQAPCPEMMCAMDKIIGCVANWNELTEEQQAEVIGMAQKIQEMKANMPKHECKHEEGHKCEGNHEGCKHEGNCKHEEGHKCEGNHEGCQHQHEGCEHNQDK